MIVEQLIDLTVSTKQLAAELARAVKVIERFTARKTRQSLAQRMLTRGLRNHHGRPNERRR